MIKTYKEYKINEFLSNIEIKDIFYQIIPFQTE